MGASLDTSKAHLVRPYGDIVAVWSWLNDGRALFLIPAHRKGAPWFIVMEQAAHEWDDHDATNIRLLAQRATKACEVLGLDPLLNANRIISIVNDAIPELVAMPSRQPTERRGPSYGQMILRADGKEIAAQEIYNESEGVTYGR